jgi:glycosyltransferase involved in cell wall biosynthesis
VAKTDAGAHIVVDGRELAGRPTGVGRYLMSILAEWAQLDGPNRVTVIVPGSVPPELAALAPRIAVEHVTAAKTGTWFEQTALPRIVRRLDADVFFAPAYTAPLTLSCPFAVVIHDLSYFVHPEWFRWREGLRRRWVTKETAKRADAIITVSEQSATELHTYLGIARSRVVLAPPGPPSRSAEHDAGSSSARSRMVLYVGSIFARRGVPALIDAMTDVVRTVPDARLVLVGDNRSTPPVDPTALATAAGIADRVDWRRYAPDAELEALYQQARVFAFLSEYEGFAMTPMEAIAHGMPAVLRDTPIAREVYGDGATLVGADRASLVSALTTLLTDDAAHRDALARGQARLRAFSWATTAATIMRALEQAAAPRGTRR